MTDAPAPTPSTDPTTDGPDEYERERRAKLQKLRDLGVDPYGQRTEGVQRLADVRAMHSPDFGQDGGPAVTVAGRVMLKRDMGKLSFLTLRDETGDLQVAVDKRRVDDLSWQIRDLTDLGDRVVVTGPLGATNKGEVTVWATSLGMAAKALLPPPGKYHGLEDVELRYRRRYVDLWSNPGAMDVLKKRSQIIECMRRFLLARGFTEVETPMLQPIHGGAAARPFATHHQALDLPLYLRIAPELYLKRLLVGGMGKVFEVNRNFRNEGISPRHNPEFTMMEAYEAFGSWETMAELVEEMICHVAMEVLGSLQIQHRDKYGEVSRTINLEGDVSKPTGRRWQRIRMDELVWEWSRRKLNHSWLFNKVSLQENDPKLFDKIVSARVRSIYSDAKRELELIGLRQGRGDALTEPMSVLSERQRKQTDEDLLRLRRRVENLQERETQAIANMSPAEQLVDVYEKFVEPDLIDPCFVTHVPSVIIPLAKPNKEDPYFADVYELAINGQEISPGYTELNDPDVQAEQFRRQVGDAAERQAVDGDFLTALKYGMPPAGGMGLGIDRLVMMLLGQESIRDVIAFPLMRPGR